MKTHSPAKKRRPSVDSKDTKMVQAVKYKGITEKANRPGEGTHTPNEAELEEKRPKWVQICLERRHEGKVFLPDANANV
jgi:hypothetical protein